MSFDTTTRVNVSHEDPVIEAGLEAILSRIAGVRIVRAAHPIQADLHVTDYAKGMELVRESQQYLARAERQPRVLIITWQEREWDLRQALSAGVHGYLVQGCEVAELIEAVQALSHGRRYLSRQLGDLLADSMMSVALTAREASVLQLLATGMCNKQVCTELGLALGTVKSHVKSVFSKLGVNSRTRAIVVATQRGLVVPPDARPPQPGLSVPTEVLMVKTRPPARARAS